ncbi:MAG: thiamine-phosphate kinase [Pseudomonadota bacterium]
MQETLWIERFIRPLVRARGAHDLRDDVAILSAGGASIVTMDTLVEGVHFLPADPPDTVGQKLVRVNVSDILAKGARPSEALLSIAWPRVWSEAKFADLVGGIGRDLDQFEAALIGGDLVATAGPLTLTMTMTGSCLKSEPVRRSGGRPGQGVFVNGEIGWGGLGLRAAMTGTAPKIAQRYRVPDIGPLEVAQTIADFATASMDISDGLLIDAERLAAASECGVEIELSRVPLAKPTETVDEILAQCTSGDDYRILISGPSGTSVPGFTQVGTLTESRGLKLRFRNTQINPPATLGFEHRSGIKGSDSR